MTKNIQIDDMFFLLIGCVDYYIEESTSIVETEIKVTDSIRYETLISELKDGDFKEKVKKTYKKMLKIRNKLEGKTHDK